MTCIFVFLLIILLILRCYPELKNNKDDFINYYDYSANAYIEPKKDSYFDYSSIIKQFKRLFQLLKFKKAFKNFKVEIIVENARIHTAKEYDVNLISKSPGTACPYDKITWIENGNENHVDCFDSTKTSKGLLRIA